MIGSQFGGFPVPSAARPPVAQQGGISWVQGEAGANAAFVPFGQTAVFFDSNSDRFWMKSVDPTGRPLPLQEFSYARVVPAQEQAAAPALTREEVQEMINQALAAFQQKEVISHEQHDLSADAE